MNDSEKILILHRLQRAEYTLSEAAYLAEGNFNAGAASSTYFACFYAVSALLLTRNLSSKTHRGTRILFAQHIVSEGLVDSSASKIYNRLFEYRQESDYDDFPEISPETASQLIAEARTFVAEISALTLKALA